MSSSNDPYKSRLFNFLNRQTIRFQDQIGITVRKLRSTTEMGIQIMLYPFYLMVQSGRAARQQLESKVQSSLLLSGVETSKSDSSLTPTSVPLDEVLNLVEPWLEAKENIGSIEAETVEISPVKEISEKADPWFNLPALPKRQKKQPADSAQLENIQTRFSPLSSQSSLEIQGIASLLDSHQIVLVDYHNRILNVLNPRQQQILQQYLAQKHQKPNLLITTAHKVLANLPQISKNNSAQTSPVKFVWQTLDWLQTSPVAKKVNLFGESQLASSAPVLPPNTDFLDDRSSSTNLQTNLTQSQPDLTSNPFQIRAIIGAAIEHFFGTNSSEAERQIQDSSNRVTLPNSAKNIPLESKTASFYLPGDSLELNSPPAGEQESWLSWNDIFSNTVSSTVKPLSSEERESSDQSKQPQQSQPLFSFPPENTENTKDVASIISFNIPDTQLETASDLLETKATTVGYEKHLLEKALEILDRIIVWLEERLLKVWQRLGKYLNK